MSVITLSDSRLGNFYSQNPTFDILTFNFSNQTALSQLNWQGLDQATIVDLLKQYQRLLRLNPNPIIAQNLLTGSQTPIPSSPTPPSASSTPRVGAAPGEPGTAVAMPVQVAPPVAVAEPSSPNPILTSAHAIVALPEAEFVQTYSPAVGGEDAARTIYRNAKDTQARTMLLWANARTLAAAPHFQSMRVNNISDSLVEHFQNLPSYQDMFGSLNYCECEHCRSIFSPAAYFVDLMRIAKENIQHKNPEPGELNFSLAARRPDLAHIPLTCENTNNEIPYLDIVNKALALNAAKAGVVSYWPLDEGSGQRIGDQIGNNTGTLQGNAQWITATDFPGVPHKSVLQFDGTTNYISIPDHLSLQIQAYTVEVWIKPDGTPQQGWTGIVGKPGRNFNIWLNQAGFIHHRFHTAASCNTGAPNTENGSITWNQWNYVVITNDGTTARTYINGTLKAEGPTGGSLIVDKTSLYIGRNLDETSDNPPSFLKGQIANIRIWDVALAPNDIRLLDNEETAIDAAYQILAVANYPSNLPFNLPLEQIRAYLRQLNTDLASIYRVFGVSEDEIARESLGLSIEEYNLITQPKPNLDDLSAIYDLPANNLSKLLDTDTFLQKTGISRQEFHDLHCQNLSPDELSQGLTHQFYIHQVPGKATSILKPDGLIGYWFLDEGIGTSIGDQVGSYNGGLTGKANWDVTSVPGTASRPVLKFDGQTYINYGNILNPTNQCLTIECWFKCDQIIGEHIVYNKETVYIAGVQNGYFRYALQPHWPNWDGEQSFSVEAEKWYHAVVVYDGTKEYLYKNGVLVFSREQSGDFTPNEQPFLIGARAFPKLPDSHFQGQIADVRVWNTALSDDEVRSHYLNPSFLNPVTLDRVNRFIRLAKKLNWSFADLNWVLTSLKASEITSDTIQQIAKIKLLKDKLNLPLDVLCSFWYDLKTIGSNDSGPSQALFDVVFNNPQLLGKQAPYHPGSYTRNPGYTDPVSQLLKNPDDSSKIAEMQLRSRIAAGLRTNLDDLAALIHTFLLNEPSTDPIRLTVENLSILHRHAKLASLLQLPTEQYLLFLNLLGKQKPAFEIQDIIDIFDFAIWLKFSGFNVYELDYILNDHESKYVKVKKSDEEIQVFLRSLWASKIDNQPPLKVDDILDWSNLCRQLSNSNLTVSKKIQDTLSLDTQQDIQQLAKDITTLTSEKKSKIIQALNDHLKQILFENKQDLESVPVSEEVKNLLTSDTVRSQNEIQKLNRLLLEAAYPHEIAKGGIRQIEDEWKEKLLEQLAIFFGSTKDISEPLLELLAKRLRHDIPEGVFSYIEAFWAPASDPSTNPNFKYIQRALHALSKVLLLSQKLRLTPAEMHNILRHSHFYGIHNNFETISLDHFKNLFSLKQLALAFNDTHNDLLRFIESQDPSNALLLEITGWDKEQIDKLTKEHFPNALNSIAGIVQLKQVVDLSRAIGVNISFFDQILALANANLSTSENWGTFKKAAQSVLEVVKAKYHDDDWAKVSDRLNSSLNESKRDALASFVLWQLQQRDDSIKTLRQLSEYLLLDVETTGCASISPIKQATLSLQMYLQRCRMNLEPGVTQVDIPAVWWEWMMNYRVWEANRKVFLYPENYIEPNLRKDKTDLFKELESELLQTEITQESVEAAYRNYFDKLAELARLRIAETYRCKVEQPNGTTVDTLFIFGKTATEPRTYYYRTCIIKPTADSPTGSLTWNPWIKIDLNINSDYISPVFAFNKLFVFWVEIKETTDSNMTNGKTQKTTTTKATIKYTFQTVSQKWAQPQTLRGDIMISRQDIFQNDTAQQIHNVDPIWEKVYPLPLPARALNSEEILIAFGDLTIQSYPKGYKFSTPVVTLNSDLLSKSSFLSILNSSTQVSGGMASEPILLKNYTLDFSTFYLQSGLISAWSLDEGTGKLIYDQIGTNNGFLEGEPSILEKNINWRQINDFPGVSSRFVLELVKTERLNIPLNEPETEVTHDLWFKTSSPNCGILAATNDRGGFDRTLYLSGGNIKARIYNNETIGSSNLNLADNKWHHLVHAFGTSIGGQKIFIDGQLVASGSKGTSDFSEQSRILVGYSQDAQDQYFKGQIADFRIRNMALNSEQIHLGPVQQENITFSKANYCILTVKNQPNWFTYDNGDEAFLVIPKGVQPPLINESLEITVNPSLALMELSYTGTSQSTPDHFAFIRLTTSTIHQLSQKAFIGGINHLLTLDSQLLPEFDFTRFNPSSSVIAPTNQALDSKSAFGLYFQEIFFHIPFLVANTLNANQHFAEAQKWYHYIFNPTHSQPQLPQPIAYWPLDEGSGGAESEVHDRVASNKSTLKGKPQWAKVSDFPGASSRSVLQFDEQRTYVDIPPTAINDLKSGTIEAWIYLEDDRCATITAKQHNNVNTYAVFSIGYLAHGVGDPGRVYFHSSNTGGKIASNGIINTHEWTHVAVTFSDQFATLYINGEVSSATAGNFSIPPDIASETFTRLGSWNEGQGDKSLSGKLANVRIWNIALRPDQILSISGRSPSDRFWRHLPFRGNTLKKLQEILKDDSAIKAYNDDPFDPHAIAQLRIGAYQKAIVMKYIDNLLDWGDSLYAQDTWESITQATMFYLLAYDLLGPKPEDLGKCPVPTPKTFDDIQQKNGQGIPQFLIDLEQTVGNSQTSALTSTPFNNLNTYFGISENEQFIAYWDRVEARLYKIRHCQNLEGIVRQLALFEPPINPMDLVRAVAAGNVPMSVVSGLTATVPHYRFDHMLDRAKNITSTVIQLGSSLLSALEKKDAEQLSLLRASQESAILRLIKTTKENQAKEAQANLESLNKSLASASDRANYYNDLIQNGWNDAEKASLGLLSSAILLGEAANVLHLSSSPYWGVPSIFGFANGNQKIAAIIQAVGTALSEKANSLNQASSLSSTISQYHRRAEEWEFQLKMANDEIALINQQITAAQINIEIAISELNAHQKSIEHADEVENFLKTKFSTPDLYQWMVSRLSTLYFQTFKIALDLALAAQKAYQYELNKDDTYISLDYWDSLKKGLLAGEGLMLGLNQLEKAYLEGNERRLEIEKTISLKDLNNGQALEALKATGKCQFELSQQDFDSDFPGHYCRQIKTISISVPAVVGPYQNIKATLTQLSDKILLKPDPDVVQLLLERRPLTEVEPSKLRSSWRRNQKIALSKGINDTGLFELNFRDERYLPFEGTGAISTWELSLPKDTNQNLDFDNLTDVIVNLSYTALDAGDGELKDK